MVGAMAGAVAGAKLGTYFEGIAGGGKGGIADGFGGPIPPGGLGWPMPPSGDGSSIGPEGMGRPGIDGGNGGAEGMGGGGKGGGPMLPIGLEPPGRPPGPNRISEQDLNTSCHTLSSRTCIMKSASSARMAFHTTGVRAWLSWYEKQSIPQSPVQLVNFISHPADMAARRADKLLVGSTAGASRLVDPWPEAATPITK